MNLEFTDLDVVTGTVGSVTERWRSPRGLLHKCLLAVPHVVQRPKETG